MADYQTTTDVDFSFFAKHYFQFHSAILIGWISVILAATAFPYSLFGELSICSTIRDLLTLRRHHSLDFLDIFRVIAICWIVSNHLAHGRLDVLERLPSADEFKKSVHNHLILGPIFGNSALGVEIFLTLSGLLAARSWHTKAKVNSERPLVFSMAFLVRRWLSYLWYLGLDWQLYLLLPFFMWILGKRGNIWFSIFPLMLIGSSLLRAYYCRTYGFCNNSDVDIPFVSFAGLDAAQLKHIYNGIWDMYSKPPTNLGPFLIGLLVGHFVTSLEESVKKPVLLGKHSLTLFSTGFIAALLTIYGVLPEYWEPNQGDNVYNTIYTAVFRTTFSVSIAAMVIGIYYIPKRKPISPYWSVLAKLSFNVYLVHMPLIYLLNFSSKFQTIETAWGLLATLPLVIILSFIFAFLFHCFFERPISRIISKINIPY